MSVEKVTNVPPALLLEHSEALGKLEKIKKPKKSKEDFTDAEIEAVNTAVLNATKTMTPMTSVIIEEVPVASVVSGPLTAKIIRRPRRRTARKARRNVA